jgi:hypothetical protein
MQVRLLASRRRPSGTLLLLSPLKILPLFLEPMDLTGLETWRAQVKNYNVLLTSEFSVVSQVED